MENKQTNKIAMQNSPTQNNIRLSGKLKKVPGLEWLLRAVFTRYIISALHLIRCIKLACAVLILHSMYLIKNIYKSITHCCLFHIPTAFRKSSSQKSHLV